MLRIVRHQIKAVFKAKQLRGGPACHDRVQQPGPRFGQELAFKNRPVLEGPRCGPVKASPQFGQCVSLFSDRANTYG